MMSVQLFKKKILIQHWKCHIPPQSGNVYCLIWCPAIVKINRTGPIFVLCLWDRLWWLAGIRRVLSVFQGRPTFRWLKPYRPHPSLPVVFIYHTCGPISPHVYNEIKMVTFCNTFRGLYWRSFSPRLLIVATASRCRCFTHCFKKLA